MILHTAYSDGRGASFRQLLKMFKLALKLGSWVNLNTVGDILLMRMKDDIHRFF